MRPGFRNRVLGGGSDFERTFRRGEYAALTARYRGRTRLWLTLIVGATLTAVAFAVGSLDELRERMDNPFTNIVDKGIYIGDRPAFERVRKQLLQPGVGEVMGLDTITDWSVFTLNVFPADEPLRSSVDPTRSLRGRTVDYRSALFNYVFVPGNILRGADFRDPGVSNDYEREGGIVIRAAALEDLGYAPKNFARIRRLPVYENTLAGVYHLSVLAIVNDLPSNADFVSSREFYLSLYGENCQSSSFTGNREGDNNLRFLVVAEREAAFRSKVERLIGREADLEVDSEPVPSDGRRELRRVTLSVRVPYVRARPRFYADLLYGLGGEASPDLVFHQYLRTRTRCKKSGAQQASFVFNDLRSIREFRKYLLDESGIDLPIDVVENKENFAMVSRLGLTIGAALLLFSLVSIAFFLRGLIEGHFEEVKTKLGTFRAFGLSSRALVVQYRRVVTVLLLEAVGGGCLIALAVGILLHVGKIDGYSTLNPWFLGTIASLFVVSRWLGGRLIRRLLSQTPGDLVYGRA